MYSRRDHRSARLRPAGHSGAGCDSGAYEFTVAPLAPAPQAATTAWAIGPNQAIQYYDATSARWQKIDGLALRIALGAAGQLYVVNGGGLIYRRAKGANGYVDGSWQQLPGTATDIGAGADGSVWTIGTAANPGGDANGHPILYFDASTASFKPVDGSATSIAVAPDGQPWVVNASGQIYRRTRGATGYVDGAWQTVTGTARDIGVGSDGSVWTIGTNQLDGGYGISRYDATSGTWQAISGAARTHRRG